MPFVKWRIEHENIVLENNKPDENLNTIVIRPVWVYGCKNGHLRDYLEFNIKDKYVNVVGMGITFVVLFISKT